jgi:hypothetical protein
MDVMNDVDASSAAAPTPAGLIALTGQLHDLGDRSASVSALAKKLDLPRPTLIRWGRQGRAFGPERLNAATQIEARLRERLALVEAETSEKAEDGPSTRSEGDDSGQPKKAASEAPEAAPKENVADDSDAEWTRRQREYGGTAGAEAIDGSPAELRERADQALTRLKLANPRPARVARGLIEAPDGVLDYDDAFTGPMVLPPQITDRLVRGNVSMVVADPNIGKTTLISSMAQAISYENPSLIGQTKIDWCGPAMIVSNEEVSDYVWARWRAQRKHLQLPNRGRHLLSVWPEPLRLARVQDGVIVPTAQACRFVEILAARAERGICYAYIALDPFNSLFEGLNENDATQTGAAIRFIKRIAEAAFAAVDVVHHTGKSTRGSETVVAYRGSTGIEAATDEISTLVTLPEDEARKLGLPPGRAERTLRLKGQRARGPWGGTHYFEREILSVPAVDSRLPNQLSAGSVAILISLPPPTNPGVSLDEAHRSLWEAHQRDGKKRLTRGQRGAGSPGEAVGVVMRQSGCDRKAAEQAIDDLEQQGSVRIEEVWIDKKNLRPVVIPEPPRAAAPDQTEIPF